MRFFVLAGLMIIPTSSWSQGSPRADIDHVIIAINSLDQGIRDFAALTGVTAEKGGDVAYVGSDWNEGVQPWDFGVPYNLRESEPLLRGTVFSDRGVYRLGEEVRFKAILRHNTPTGIQLLPAGTAKGETVTIMIRPEDIAITSEAPERDRNVLPGVVIGSSFLGNLVDYSVETARLVLHVQVPRGATFERAERVYLTVQPERCFGIGSEK